MWDNLIHLDDPFYQINEGNEGPEFPMNAYPPEDIL
jgi:hypothetical protein